MLAERPFDGSLLGPGSLAVSAHCDAACAAVETILINQPIEHPVFFLSPEEFQAREEEGPLLSYSVGALTLTATPSPPIKNYWLDSWNSSLGREPVHTGDTSQTVGVAGTYATHTVSQMHWLLWELLGAQHV